MGDSSTSGAEMNNSDMFDLTGKITVVSILVVFVIVVFVFLLHIYAKWYWTRRREELINSDEAAARRRFVDDLNSIASRQGLDQSVLKTIPVLIFSATEFKEGLECSVCLCEVSEGEKARFLPNCNHGFHVNCIDTWFKSHSSCPICRNLIKNPNPESPRLQNTENHTSEPPRNFPTNVLFWGNDVEVRTLGNYTEEEAQQQPTSSSIPSSSARVGGVLVIDIPQQTNEGDEGLKSPVQTRLGSLKRLLTRDNRKVGPCCTPREIDVEQATTIRS